MEGTVKWFNADKGYGFIAGSDQSYYLAHFGEIQLDGYKTLKEGQAVTFDTEEGPKGKIAKSIIEA